MENVKPIISLVVPVYNEEEALTLFLETVQSVLAGITESYEIIFAADPCTDETIPLLMAAHEKDPRIKILIFSRRFGQAAALLAGLAASKGQAVIPIDCDLQDPPSLIPQMIELWRAGNKVVIPQRRSREGETFLKKLIAYTGYWFINKISEVYIPRNAGEFRLMDRRVVNEVIKLSESHGFLRGLVAIVGFKTALLPYDRQKRISGNTKYNRYTGSFRIGFNGIIGFSDYLLNLMVKAGFIFSGLSMLAAVLVVILKFRFSINFASGVPSIMILLLFIGGINLVGLGVLGAYVSRIYDDVKKRPRYIVDEKYGIDIEL